MPVIAGTFNYCLAPWQFRTETLESGKVFEGWLPPENAVSVLDLRPINARTDVEHGTLADWGFFAIPAGGTLPGSALDCGTYLHGTLSNSLKSEIVARLPWLSPGDLSTSVTLLDAVWDMLTVASDPAGTLGPRPLMPGQSGTLGLHLQGHSEVRAEPFRWGEHPATEKIAESLRMNYEQWESQFREKSQQHRKALGALVEKYSRFGLTDYRQLLPEKYRQSPDHRPIKPETTFTDDFNRADANTLGAPWVTVLGEWSISGSQAGGQFNGTRYAQYGQDLSSDDHYSLNVMGDVSTFDDYGIVARFDSAGSGTGYLYSRRQQNGASHMLVTVVDGTQSGIGSLGGEFGSATGDLLRIECDGSTIKVIENGVTKVEVTNSDISGQLRAGMMSSDFVGNVARNSWTAADLGAAPAVTYVEAHALGRGLERGIARAIA